MGVMQRWQGKVRGSVVLVGNGGVALRTTTGLTAIGANQAGSLALSTPINVISTAAASTGVSLPQGRNVGQELIIYNDGANPIQVYGVIGGTDTIDGVAGATGVALTNARRASFRVASITAGVAAWKSALLGAVSS